MDPFKSPQIIDQTKEPSADTPPAPKRTFRFRVIPAAICWLMGGLFLLAFLVNLSTNTDRLSVNWDDELPWVLIDLIRIVRLPMVICQGLLLLYAGNRWVKGRWVTAILLSATPWFLLMGYNWLTRYLYDWAGTLP